MNALVLIVLFTGVAAAGIGIGWGVGTTVPHAAPATTSTVQTTSAPYVLTMIITTNNLFNGTTGDQPAFYVLGPSGLESSANIALPANRLIELVISNYDDGNASLAGPQYANVTGTLSGTEMVYNNTNINSTTGSNGIDLRGSQTVKSLPLGDISHTFTIPALNLNVPISTSSTVVAFFESGSAGSLTWLCEALCGSGASGASGAMVTSGWMAGGITVG